MIDVNTLIEGAKALEIELKDGELDKFISYKELLKEWNQKINITSITDDVEIDIKHFIDSITPLNTNLFKENIRVIDIGTGGGFPGIPLKIIRDDIEVLLLDSTMKKIKFLNEVIDKLELKDIKALHGRAEELGRDNKYRGKYDIAISRAVASLDTLCEFCLPFVKVGGFFISMKGSEVDQELKEANNSIKTLGGQIEDVEILELPLSDIEHSLIIIKKIKETSTKYPRGGGKPKKKPL